MKILTWNYWSIIFLIFTLGCSSDDAVAPPVEEVKEGPVAIEEEAFAFPGAEGFGRFKYLIPQHHKQEI